MSAHNTLATTSDWFQKVVAEPQEKHFTTQLGVHVEEFGEMLDELSPTDSASLVLLRNLNTCTKEVARRLKDGSIHVMIADGDRKAFLDSLCDQIVTATGIGHMQRMDMVGAVNEVNRSNYSKFDTDGNPIFDANLKVTKGPNYSPPDLEPYI